MYSAKNKARLIADLHSFLGRSGLRRYQFAELSKVDQGQCSKILNGDFKRPGKSIRKLCNYANLNHEDYTTSSDVEMPRPILTAISDVWDGSKEHAIHLARIIKATKPLRPQR